MRLRTFQENLTADWGESFGLFEGYLWRWGIVEWEGLLLR